MNKEPSPTGVISFQDWRSYFAAFYMTASRDDGYLLDNLWAKYAMHAHFAGRDAQGKPLHPEIIAAHRNDYAHEVAKVRACPTFGMIPPANQDHFEPIAFQFPPDGGKSISPSPSGDGNPTSRILRPASEMVHDYVYNDPARLREPPDNALDYREIRERIGWPHATKDSVKALLRALPARKLTLDIVYVEDEYETRAGDGYNLDPQRAYFSRGAAQAAADWITTGSRERHHGCGFRAESRRNEVVLDVDDALRVPYPKGVEMGNWEEAHLIALINGDYPYGWVSTVKCCRGDEVEPDFDAKAEREKQTVTKGRDAAEGLPLPRST